MNMRIRTRWLLVTGIPLLIIVGLMGDGLIHRISVKESMGLVDGGVRLVA
ncbi:MAG: hypothetical protein ACYTGH_09125 [Planctomycetota bacterium]